MTIPANVARQKGPQRHNTGALFFVGLTVRRLRALLSALCFSGPHFWPVLVGNTVPWLLLLIQRSYIASHEIEQATSHDIYVVNTGDWEAWGAWAFGWALGLALVDPHGEGWRGKVGRGLRAFMHLLTAGYFVLSALDLQYFAVTGSRADWDAIHVVWNDLPMFWPVIASEFRPIHAFILAVTAAFGLAPIFWRSADHGSFWRIFAYSLMFPMIWMEILDTRPHTGPALRTLQPSLSEYMYWDGIERIGETITPPTPEELLPVKVQARPEANHPNLVIVFMESVGAARTTPYHPGLQTTPNLMRMAQEGLAFENLLAVVPHTSKALVATLCGQWPRLATEVSEARPGGLPGRCLPELLAETGWRTGFFQPAREEFEDRFRLLHNLKFQTYRGRDALPNMFEVVNYFGVEDRAMLEPGLNWSAEDPSKPFLAVYLTLTSHHDYGVPSYWPIQNYPDSSPRLQKHLNAVAYVDDFIGKLVEGYEKRGLLDNTVFLILGDHGEGFGEHGRYQHDLLIWEEGMHIPGVLWGKPLTQTEERGHKITGAWQQIDLLPTLLNLLGIDVLSGYLPGVDALGAVPDRILYHSCWRSHRCLARRSGSNKFIDHYRERGPQFFDLAVDPDEKKNLISSQDNADVTEWLRDARAWRSKVEGRYAAIKDNFLASVPYQDPKPAIATWGEQIEAVSCQLEAPTIVQGASAWLDCTWRATTPVREGWEVRTRIQSGDTVFDDIWFPLDGQLPTWRWEPGQAIPDTIRVKVPHEFPLGKAKVSVGWDRLGGRTAARAEGGDWLEVGELDVIER